jgi:hypothetical protein
MLKVLLIVALAMGSVYEEPLGISISNATSFLSGLITGLGNGPTSQCSTSISNLITISTNLAQDFSAPSSSLNETISTLNDMQSFINSIDPLKTCSLDGLSAKIKAIFEKGGWEILLNNYLDNGEAIYSNHKAIMVCDTNFKACGEAIGSSFRLLVGWSLN